MSLQNFVDKSPPAISAAWLNQVDVLLTTVFGQSATKALARVALTSDAPYEIANGGTSSRTAAAALTALGGVTNAQLNTAIAAAIAALNTPFETNAIETAVLSNLGFSVVNSNYPIGWVDRYFTNSNPGTTSATEASIIACAVATAGGGDVVYGPTQLYLLDGCVNVTFGGSGNQFGFAIRFIGPNGLDGAATSPHPLSPFGVFARHSQVAVFDMTGADSVHLIGVPIRSSITTFPKTAVLWARSNAGSAANMKMLRCVIAGCFSDSCLYNYGAETNEVWGNKFYNLSTGANTANVRITANNVSGLASAFSIGSNNVAVAIATGSQSTTCHSHKSNTYVNQAGVSTSDCIVLETAGRATFDDCFALSASGTAAGRSLVYVNQTFNTSVTDIALVRFQGEQGTFLQQYGVLFDNTAAQFPVRFTIEDSRLPYSVASIGCAGANCTPTNFIVRGLAAQGSTAATIVVPGTLQTSIIEDNSVIGTIGVSNNNSLIVDTNRWGIGAGATGGITTLTAGSIRDIGVANKTFPAALGTGFTGVPAISNVRLLIDGNRMYFTLTLFLSGGWSCVAGATITGLPLSAVVRSADVNVTDSDTPSVTYASGAVLGANILLPAITSTTADTTISGSCFIS